LQYLIVLLSPLKKSMGRALFSLSYASTPAVRVEPEPIVDTCEKWGACNRFDPDSEEFFNDAQYEAFIEEDGIPQTVRAVAEGANSEGSGNDRGSSMAVESDDSTILIADAYPNAPDDWQRFLAAPPSQAAELARDRNLPPSFSRVTESITSGAPRIPGSDQQRIPDHPISNRLNRPRSFTDISPFLPQSPTRVSVAAIEIDTDRITSSRSPTTRRAVNIAPINIPIEPSLPSPSPDSPSPSTPPAIYHLRSMISSSPPSVIPRFYSWQNHPIPTSPTVSRGNRDGPLTNPHARMSFARIDSSPARIRILNTVV
jgi:hypothetical protein